MFKATIALAVLVTVAIAQTPAPTAAPAAGATPPVPTGCHLPKYTFWDDKGKGKVLFIHF